MIFQDPMSALIRALQLKPDLEALKVHEGGSKSSAVNARLICLIRWAFPIRNRA